MRFSRNIILRDGVGATPIRALARFVGIILINAITLNAQIVPPGNATRPETRGVAQLAVCRGRLATHGRSSTFRPISLLG
jgi:hypothetical protein